MQLWWGSFAFPVNQCSVTAEIRPTLSDTGRPVGSVARMSVAGTLTGTDQANTTALGNALVAALAIPYQTLSLRQDDGTPSLHTLNNATSVSGVRVVRGPTFPKGDGPQLGTLLDFTFEAEAEFVLRSGQGAVLSFTETVSIIGTGGPVNRYRPAINGPPVKQQVYPASVVRATQSGMALGYTAYPAFPLPLWPDFEQVDQRQQHRKSPRNAGKGFLEFPVQWSYSFEANVPLVGLPGLPPL